MEILELEKEEKVEEKIEEKDLTKTLLSSIKKDDYTDFLVLLLKPNYSYDYSNLDMFGIKAIDYVKTAVQDFELKLIDYDLNDDIIQVVKQNLNDKKYVLVLFTDTPLIKKSTLFTVLDYFLFKSLCALKFNRGYVFDTAYLKTVEKIYNPQEQNFNEEDFIKVDSSKNFSLALDVLKNRIISYHQDNGVIFNNAKSSYIDAVVNIDSGVIIGNNVTIKGKSIIKSNSFLENTTLNRVIIGKSVIIQNSILENSVVNENAKITDYCVIKNTTVKENTMLCNKQII